MLCKTGTVCFRVVDPHFMYDLICFRTILTHMRCFLQEDLALALKKLFSICPIPILNPLTSGGDM